MRETRLSIQDRVENAIFEGLKERNYNGEVLLTKSSLGWIQLRVVSQAFTGLDEEDREAIVDRSLEKIDMHLGMYPFTGYALLTPDEASNEPATQLVQLPLWSEILLAPEPEPVDDGLMVGEKIPLVVTFYSFKGGRTDNRPGYYSRFAG